MKSTVFLMALAIGLTTTPAFSNDAVSKLSESERAKIRSQVKGLQDSALKEGERAAAASTEVGKRNVEDIKKQQETLSKRVDQKQAEWSWVIGPDAAKFAAEAKRKGLSDEAARRQYEAMKSANQDAQKKRDSAQKKAEGVMQTVEGLKSQIPQKGQYGLQPKGSSLYVRKYGK